MCDGFRLHLHRPSATEMSVEQQVSVSVHGNAEAVEVLEQPVICQGVQTTLEHERNPRRKSGNNSLAIFQSREIERDGLPCQRSGLSRPSLELMQE